MSDYRFGVGDYRLNYRPHEAMDENGYVDWEKVEAVEIERVDFIRKPDDKSRWFELFGTPEKAARTLAEDYTDCDYDALLEWLCMEGGHDGISDQRPFRT